MSLHGTIQLVTFGSRQVALAGLLAGGAVLPAAAAHAAVVAVSCTGTQSNTYAPGLTNTPRSVTVTATGSLTCVSPGDPSSITAATETVSAALTGSCTSATGSGTRTIRWGNGKTSTLLVAATLSVNNSGQRIVTLKGTVAAGQFAGSGWSGLVTLLSANPLVCGSALGLTSATGPIQLTILAP